MAEIDPYEHELEVRLRQTENGKAFISRAGEITFTTHLVVRTGRLRSFVGHVSSTAVCADLIGPDVRLYWDPAAYKKHDSSTAFPWHQDNGYAFVDPQQ